MSTVLEERTFTTKGLSRTCYPLSPLPVIEGFDEMLVLWESKRQGRLIPSWDDFDFYDFIGWHGRVALSEWEGDDLRFRLYGTDFVRLRNLDLTNKRLCETLDPPWREDALAYFKTLVLGPFIGHTNGRVPDLEREFTLLNSLDLPLGDDGQRVSHCLHVLRRDVIEEALRALAFARA